jgi:hypothetical protein
MTELGWNAIRVRGLARVGYLRPLAVLIDLDVDELKVLGYLLLRLAPIKGRRADHLK